MRNMKNRDKIKITLCRTKGPAYLQIAHTTNSKPNFHAVVQHLQPLFLLYCHKINKTSVTKLARRRINVQKQKCS